MKSKIFASKYIPAYFIAGLVMFFTFSYVKGSSLVKKSEKEINVRNQIGEAQTAGYQLKEIDAMTGALRWQLTAKEGTTEDNLQKAFIKGITAEVFKDNEVVFHLQAPLAKGSYGTKEIYLLGGVTAENKTGDFFLKTTQLALGMGTSIEAQKGFQLSLKNTGSVKGESALINDDQTEIIVKSLTEALFKNVALSGAEVHIKKEKGGDLQNAIISNGGKVILKNEKDKNKKETLTAGEIRWSKDGEVEAIGNVVYTSADKIFKAGYLLLKSDGKVYAKNNVIIVHGNTRCTGAALSFEDKSLIVVSGKPKAFQGQNQISADKIVYNLQTGKVEAVGNVKTSVSNNKA